MKKAVGYISHTHGLAGKVKVVPMINPEEFKQVILDSLGNERMMVFYDNNNEYKNVNITISAFNGKTFICKINNVNDIEQAKLFLKKEIFIEVEDEDYIDPETLIGFTAFNNKTKQKIGKVIDYGNYGGGMLIEILLSNLDGKMKTKKSTKSEFYLCNRDFIKQIDFNRQTISINVYNLEE